MAGPGGYIVPETITGVERISVHAVAEGTNTTHIGTMVVEPGASTSTCVADDVTQTPTRIRDTVDAHNTDRVHSDPTIGVGYRATVKMKGGHAALRRTRGLIIHARTIAVHEGMEALHGLCGHEAHGDTDLGADGVEGFRCLVVFVAGTDLGWNRCGVRY